MYAPPNEYIPQIATTRRPLLMWLIVASVSLAVMAMIVVAPVAVATRPVGIEGGVVSAALPVVALTLADSNETLPAASRATTV